MRQQILNSCSATKLGFVFREIRIYILDELAILSSLLWKVKAHTFALCLCNSDRWNAPKVNYVLPVRQITSILHLLVFVYKLRSVHFVEYIV